jgi:hypothetical protein
MTTTTKTRPTWCDQTEHFGAGAPMVRTYGLRYNAAGEPIGPELRIRCCDARGRTTSLG